MKIYRYNGSSLVGIETGDLFVVNDTKFSITPRIQVVRTGNTFFLLTSRFDESVFLGDLTDKEKFIFELGGKVPERFK